MTAREIFESLDFKCDLCNHAIIYELKNDYRTYVAFLYKSKEIESTCRSDVYNKIKDKLGEAIQKQLEELGWL